jgi:hypothetical protein
VAGGLVPDRFRKSEEALAPPGMPMLQRNASAANHAMLSQFCLINEAGSHITARL